MFRFLYIIASISLIMGPIYGACCLTGIIWPPDREKRFIFNDVGEIDKAKQLIVGLPAKICTPNVRTNDSYRINDSNPNHIFFYRWPIDKKISVDIAIEYEKHAISINYYWVGEINDDNLGEINSYYESKNSSLYNQIIVIKRFEKMYYLHCNTTAIQIFTKIAIII